MKRRWRAPSPALVISLIALFVALGGTTGYASGLISGRQIVDHSIPAKKLTAAAFSALRGQRGAAGPGARSFFSGAKADSVVHLLTTTNGIDVTYKCDIDSNQIHFFLTSHSGDHGVLVSGDYVADGVLKSITRREGKNLFSGHATLNLDVIATRVGISKLARIDLAGESDGGYCGVEGLVIPGDWDSGPDFPPS